MADPTRSRRRFHRARLPTALSTRRFRPTLERLNHRCLLSTFTVTSLADVDSQGTLPWAMTQANQNPGSTIVISASGTLQLTEALPALAADVFIEGPSASATTVSGTGTGSDFSDFTVDPGATVSISGLTISAGDATAGGGVNNAGALTLANCAITDNTAVDGADRRTGLRLAGRLHDRE